MIHCTPTLGCWASSITRMATLRLADWLEVVEGLSHYDFAKYRVQATVWNNFNLQIFTKLYKAKKSWAITPSDHPAKVPANGRKGPLPVERNEGYLHNSRRFKQLGVRALARTCQHSRVTKDSFLNCIHQGPSGQKLKKKNKAMAQRYLKCICTSSKKSFVIWFYLFIWNILKWINSRHPLPRSHLSSRGSSTRSSAQASLGRRLCHGFPVRISTFFWLQS